MSLVGALTLGSFAMVLGVIPKAQAAYWVQVAYAIFLWAAIICIVGCDLEDLRLYRIQGRVSRKYRNNLDQRIYKLETKRNELSSRGANARAKRPLGNSAAE